MFPVIWCLIVNALAVACTESDNTANCEAGQCDTVGGTEICMQCKAGKVPIKGICKAHDTDAGAITPTGCKVSGQNPTATSVKCEQCDAVTYFLYKGGCYSTADAPGNAMCKTVTTNGICADAADSKKYFAVPGAAKTEQSVVLCSDTTGVAIAGDKTYTGVDGCATCDPPGSLSNSGTKAATCTACDNSRLVKTAKDKTTTCVTEEECASTAGFFAKGSTSKTCETCDVATYGVTDCTTCAPKAGSPDQATCTACAAGKKPNADGTSCFDCPDTGCSQCSAANQCAVCIDGYRKTDSSTCEKCTPENCKACTSDAKICTECVAGYAPSADGSSCASSSANRSGLSTGAIAGISVAVIVVVGGLVGFLCWWFVCRGKA